MSEKETKIYEGLKSIGVEIATFFADAVTISKMEIDSKPYLLSHLAREIEGGLRDILVVKDESEKIICLGCSQPVNKSIGHKESILKALGVEDENEIAKKWHKTANTFHRFAHRSGVWKDPRDRESFNNNWNNFLEVLEYLVGNYYSISDRLDSILSAEKPTSSMLGTLKNLVQQNARNVYFYNNLTNSKWLKPLKDHGFFNADMNPRPLEDSNNPGFYSMPYWNCLSYLEQTSRQNFSDPNSEITEVLLAIIKEIILHKDKRGSRVENYRTDYSIFNIICSLPVGSMIDLHIDFIELALKSSWHGLIGHEFGLLIERVLKEGNAELIRRTVKILFAYKIDENKTYESIQSIFQSYELRNILDKYKNDLIKTTGKDFLKIVSDILSSAEKIDSSIFSVVKIPTIEDHEQTAFPEEYGCQIVYAVRDSLEKLPQEEILDYLKKELKNNSSVLKRISLHTINIRYKEFSNLFWEYEGNLLKDTIAKHELYELLKDHSKEFSEEKIQKVVNWIEELEPSRNFSAMNEEEWAYKNLAYKKKEWLTALIGTNNQIVLDLYKKQNAISEGEIEHPGFSSWSSGMFGNTTPLPVSDLATMELKEILDFYKGFTPKENDFMGPSKDGLLDAIVLCVKNEPVKYAVNCDIILEAEPEFQNAWLRGLNDAWRIEKIEFNASQVLKVVNEIVLKENFWDDANKNYAKDWLVSTILSFIDDGIRARSKEFEIENLNIIKNTLLVISKNERSEINDFKDLSMTALNNVKGKLYSCLIEYSLWNSRNLPESTDSVGFWDKEIKDTIVCLISEKNDNVLLHHTIGNYLLNIAYLDRDWVIKNFSIIFPIKNEKCWSGAMDGYFFYQENPIEFIFELFANEKHFELALQKDFENISGNAKKHIITSICIAYLLDYKSAQLNSTLLKMLLGTKTEYVYSNLIYFFWDPQGRIGQKFLKKVRDIWEYLYNDCINMTSPEIDKVFLSGSCKWLNTVDKLDDKVYEIIKNSVAFLNQRDRYFVLEILDKHAKDSTKYVAEILLSIFTKEITYDGREKVKNTIEILYENGQKDIADKICILHGERGFEVLRELYKKYNNI